MVSLAVAEKYTRGPPVKAESFRDNALWFPDIPENHLQLNEAYFTGINDPASGFEPLFYALFRDMCNPRPLTKVIVLWEGCYIATIDFHYATGDIVRLGRPRDDYRDYEIIFDIDGAAGEVIKSMKIGRAEHEDALYGKPGRLISLQVSLYLEGLVLLIVQISYIST